MADTQDAPKPKHTMQTNALFSTYRINIQVDNQTEYQLIPNGSWANYGTVESSPITVHGSKTVPGGSFKDTRAPLVGTAGIVGYKTTTSHPPLWFVFLASDPCWNTEENKTAVLVSKTPQDINENTYKQVWKRGNKDYVDMENGHGKIIATSEIGTSDTCVATFYVRQTFD